MNPNRNGKIACLPELIRNEVNRRLHAGERGQRLIGWLNSLPEVRQVMHKRFHGKPINNVNLTEWKAGGYRDWKMEHETPALPRSQPAVREWQRQPFQQQQGKPWKQEEPDEMDDETEDSQVADAAAISDQLAIRLGLELTRFAETWLAKGTWSRERWRRLRELLAALAQLRRGDHRAANVDIAQDRWRDELEQREFEQSEKRIKEMKSAALNPLKALSELPTMARLEGGGALGWQLAARYLETKYDLEPGTLLPKCPGQPGKGKQAPVENPDPKSPESGESKSKAGEDINQNPGNSAKI